MNNKYVKYFLIVAVIGVWASIFYRVIHALGRPDEPFMVVAPAPSPVQTLSDDTFHLFADYPDPFLGEDTMRADTAAAATAKPMAAPVTAGPVAPVITREMVAGIVQYKGVISNPQKRTRVAILMLHGKEYLARENDKIEDIRILAIGKTRISIRYKEQVFTLDK